MNNTKYEQSSPDFKYEQSSPESIQALFSSIATNYDRGNATLSFGLHKQWNRALVKAAIAHAPLNATLLDLCAGTGDIAFAALQKSDTFRTTYLLDFCADMLACAKVKADRTQLNQDNIQYIVGDAQEVPLPDQSIDIVTTAYGIRNIQDPLRCAREVRRLLKPGGWWGILELTRPRAPLLQSMHRLYLNTLLPTLGRLVATNKEAYQYLSQSIQHFVSPEDLAHQLQQAGFVKIKIKSLYFGIATLITAE
jgi:demethylmenaquinone methyltransferase / 2-methoxy-6-polyprenyl-1,4-benzoquinol methylase